MIGEQDPCGAQCDGLHLCFCAVVRGGGVDVEVEEGVHEGKRCGFDDAYNARAQVEGGFDVWHEEADEGQWCGDLL